jgi:hypothetical protein
MLLALTAGDGEPAVRQYRLRLAAVGIVIGVAVASRFVNGLLGPLCLAIVVVQVPAARRLRTAIEAGVVMPLVAVATFFTLWPRLWLHPIASLQESLAKLSQSHAVEPYLGTLTNQPGSSYFFAYLAATVPIMILAGAVGWFARALGERTRGSLIVALWFVIPLAVMASPVRQDGVRYVMPCVVVIALMSAAGWEYFVSLAERVIPRAFVIWAALAVGYLGVTLVRVHPLYIDYYGEQVGGPRAVAANKLFEVAWWGEGVADAVDYVNAHAAPGARVFRNCIEPVHLAWFRQDLWTPMTNQPAQAEWIIAYAPSTKSCPVPAGFRAVHTVDVLGAVLAIVYQR